MSTANLKKLITHANLIEFYSNKHTYQSQALHQPSITH